MTEQNLKEEFDKLNIVSFDCNGIATKSDVMTALSAVKTHLSAHSDESTLETIDRIKAERQARRFKGVQAE